MNVAYAKGAVGSASSTGTMNTPGKLVITADVDGTTDACMIVGRDAGSFGTSPEGCAITHPCCAKTATRNAEVAARARNRRVLRAFALVMSDRRRPACREREACRLRTGDVP